MRLSLLLLLVVWGAAPAFAQANLSGVVINEILADPNSTSDNFDTDGDGTAESNDEFVELYNNGSSAVDISSWELYDGAGFRHAFTASTVLNPGDFIVV
ncbi:MAG: lamin tail domain-containing protein, partial [Bacteroidota bacterium]